MTLPHAPLHSHPCSTAGKAVCAAIPCPDCAVRRACTGNTAQNADIEAKLRRRCEAAGVKYVGVGCGLYKAELEHERRREMQLKRHKALQKACQRAEEKAKQTAAAEASDRPVSIMAAAACWRPRLAGWLAAACMTLF